MKNLGKSVQDQNLPYRSYTDSLINIILSPVEKGKVSWVFFPFFFLFAMNSGNILQKPYLFWSYCNFFTSSYYNFFKQGNRWTKLK